MHQGISRVRTLNPRQQRERHPPTSALATNAVRTGTEQQRRTGSTLTESRVISRNRQVAVNEARRKLQEKYNKEAEEAAERQRQKEQKKRETWLARQERQVRPGHVLGRDRQVSQMLQRDVDSGDEDEYVSEQRQLMQEQYKQLAEQHARRLKEAKEMKVVRESYNSQQREHASIDLSALTIGPAPSRGDTNQTAKHFLGTGYNGAASNSIPGAAANIRPAAASPSAGAHGHVLGSSAATTSCSDVAQTDPREQMLAARARLQAQYDQQVRTLASAEDAEGQDT